MARVTVEDCIVKIPNRFRLVMLASQRSRDLSKGLDLTVERDNDKNPVVALREIAEDKVDIEELEGDLVRGQQKHIDVDEQADEGDDFLTVDDAFSERTMDSDSVSAHDVGDDPLARALSGAAFDDVDAGDEDAAEADSTKDGEESGKDGKESDAE